MFFSSRNHFDSMFIALKGNYFWNQFIPSLNIVGILCILISGISKRQKSTFGGHVRPSKVKISLRIRAVIKIFTWRILDGLPASV